MAKRAKLGSPIVVGQTRYRNIQGLEQLQRRIAALPPCLGEEMADALDKSAEIFVAKAKSIAPVSDLEGHPGELRDSIDWEDGPHDLSVRMFADAKDAHGHPYPFHVDAGHRTASGGHAAAQPFWWLAYHLVKPQIKRLMSAAARSGARKAIALGGPKT